MKIFISNKLKKLYKTIPFSKVEEIGEIIPSENSWNADYTNVYGKKCLVMTHSLTRYTVIIPNFKVKDVKCFDEIFAANLENQISFKNEIDEKFILQFVKDLKFFPTNNDKGCIGSNNTRIQELEYYKENFQSFNEFNFGKIASYLNEIVGKKVDGKLKYIHPNKEILKFITENSK